MRLGRDFFLRDALEVAPELIGKTIVRTLDDGTEIRLTITETEVYRGEEVYVYLCYGIHWLLNIITGPAGHPQGVLIRACEGFEGPGKLTKKLAVTGEFNGADITTSPLLRLEDEGKMVNIITDKRVGIAYADERDRERLWRFKRG